MSFGELVYANHHFQGEFLSENRHFRILLKFPHREYCENKFYNMPTNAVYQPTTVSFENSGGSLLAQTTAGSRLKLAFRTTIRKTCLLVASLVFISLGIILTASATADYEDATANEDVVTDIPVHEKELDIGFIVLGAFFTIFGFILLGKSQNVMVMNAILRNYCQLYRIVHQGG